MTSAGTRTKRETTMSNLSAELVLRKVAGKKAVTASFTDDEQASWEIPAPITRSLDPMMFQETPPDKVM